MSVSKFHLILMVHAHQPVGNFDHVFEQAYQRCYRPFVEALRQHPTVHIGLHLSGVLLEWCEQHHPEFFERVAELAERRQVELIGGAFYEPILVSIPLEDRREQIRLLSDYLERRFGRRPTGAWLAERVWEPQLPSTFAAADVDYSLVDDNHFHASGFSGEQLFGYYVAEDLGRTVKLFPGLRALRYLIPFQDVEETIRFLRTAAERHPGGCAVFGDDCEKFGVWPETYEHCYTNGWLERFFAALEENSAWLVTTTPGEYASSNPPLGRADLPTASYSEMMEWALPAAARAVFHQLDDELRGRREAQPFLRGGFWRVFLSKYSEANLLHKKMLLVSAKVRRMVEVGDAQAQPPRPVETARQHLLRGQCNDAYWHGVFGGLYAPHLRTAVWRELIRAETLADAARHSTARYQELHRLDFDSDGREELYWVSGAMAALVKPSDGATMPFVDFRPPAVALINSLQRREEAYHAKLAQVQAAPTHSVASIHQRVRAKEPGLEAYLRYDKWPRQAFRLYLFAPWKQHDDYARLHLEESEPFAGGDYRVVSASLEEIELTLQSALVTPTSLDVQPGAVTALKSFTFRRGTASADLICGVSLSHTMAEELRLLVGLEVVVNFLAPDAPDRYFQIGEGRQPLRWSGSVRGPELRIVDEWQNVAVNLRAPQAREIWVAPIETVSESEDGFERIYQGSQILAVWPLELVTSVEWRCQLRLHITTVR